MLFAQFKLSIPTSSILRHAFLSAGGGYFLPKRLSPVTAFVLATLSIKPSRSVVHASIPVSSTSESSIESISSISALNVVSDWNENNIVWIDVTEAIKPIADVMATLPSTTISWSEPRLFALHFHGWVVRAVLWVVRTVLADIAIIVVLAVRIGSAWTRISCGAKCRELTWG